MGFRVFYGIFLSETYGIQDCVDYDDASSDKSSKYGSSITLRGTITASVTYGSTNQRYSITNDSSGGEALIPINSATGLDDITIEFDAIFIASSNFMGLITYKDSSNWGRLASKYINSGAFEQGKNINGSYSEGDISGYTFSSNTWLHHKYTITNNTVKRQVYTGDTLLYEDTTTYDSSWFNSSTKYGFSVLWDYNWHGYFKNLKIKPL